MVPMPYKRQLKFLGRKRDWKQEGSLKDCKKQKA
jgi:hypothetical protein